VLTSPIDLAMKAVTNPATFETLKKARGRGGSGPFHRAVPSPTLEGRARSHEQAAENHGNRGDSARTPQVTQNVAQHPTEAKYRRLKLANEKIEALLVNVPGAVQTLLELGWQRETDPVDGDVLVLPPAKHMSMADVRRVEQGEARLVEALKVKARNEAAARSRPLDPERERLRLQMEADRRERAARGPVTQGSVAQPLPGDFGGAKVAGPGGSAAGGHGHGSGPVRCVHDESQWRSLLAESSKSGKAVIIDFSATWCGPCKMIGPVFEQLAAQHTAVIFAKVDVDEAQDVASQCGVTSMPTFQLYKRGQRVDSFSGADTQRLHAMVAAAQAP